MEAQVWTCLLDIMTPVCIYNIPSEYDVFVHHTYYFCQPVRRSWCSPSTASWMLSVEARLHVDWSLMWWKRKHGSVSQSCNGINKNKHFIIIHDEVYAPQAKVEHTHQQTTNSCKSLDICLGLLRQSRRPKSFICPLSDLCTLFHFHCAIN